MVAAQPIGATMRYRLLDTTRAYALEIQADDIERTDLAMRHATYYRRWLEQFGADWSSLSTGTERVPHFIALNNVRAALEWCFGGKGNIEIGVVLAASAAPVFLAMSLLSECHRWSERAIAALTDAARGGAPEMQLQAALGISCTFMRGGQDEARVALGRSSRDRRATWRCPRTTPHIGPAEYVPLAYRRVQKSPFNTRGAFLPSPQRLRTARQSHRPSRYWAIRCTSAVNLTAPAWSSRQRWQVNRSPSGAWSAISALKEKTWPAGFWR